MVYNLLVEWVKTRGVLLTPFLRGSLHTIAVPSQVLVVSLVNVRLHRTYTSQRQVAETWSFLRRLQCGKHVFDWMWRRMVRWGCTAFSWASPCQEGPHSHYRMRTSYV